MKLYLEPAIFAYQYAKNETGILPRAIFRKAKEEKLELITSSLSSLQYIGKIHELFVTKKISKQTHSNYLFDYSALKIDLKNSLTYASPTKDILDISNTYVLEKNVHHEDAIHLGTSRASRCDMYVMTDQYKDLDKNEWKKNFKMIDLLEKEDVEYASYKINEL